MKFLKKNRLSLAVPLAAMGSVLFGMGVYFFQQREVFSEISSYTPPLKGEPSSESKLTSAQSETPLPQGTTPRREETLSVGTTQKITPAYEKPKPEELSRLSPEEIRGAVARDGGYVLITSFGAKWYVNEAQVGQMPYAQQVLIDYGRYKREDIENKKE
jgi:hypothetical protein